jgi:hypothetical protein
MCKLFESDHFYSSRWLSECKTLPIIGLAAAVGGEGGLGATLALV